MRAASAVIENATPSATLNVFRTGFGGDGSVWQSGDRRRRRESRGVLLSRRSTTPPPPAAFQGQLSGNAANFFGRFAPGMLATIFSFPSAPFGGATASFTAEPDCRRARRRPGLGGRNTPRRCCYVSPGQINFQVPGATPVGGLEEIQVARVSTGQVLASWLFQIDARVARPVHRGWQRIRPGGGAESGWLVEQWRESGQGGQHRDAVRHRARRLSGMPPDGQPAPGIVADAARRRRFSSIRASFRRATSSVRDWRRVSPGFGRST